ncbi:hypothetical protein J9303_20485 [Bacillaceae bacterium Marseille-Q3522]|nr:hypothetical protein [Bacillaceae bacterium Marseille-Q3522]
MEDILRPIYQERTSQKNTLGVLIVEKNQRDTPATDTFDAILFIVIKDDEQPVFVKHYTYGKQIAALYIVTELQLRKWILMGTNRKIFDWLLNGRILFDRNEFVTQLKNELIEFPANERKRKMGIEFAKLIRRYVDGKSFFENKHYLDAFNYIVHSLHHLARLSVIENGFHPEVTVWHQVKQIEPEIFKLYDELVNSSETIDKRLELLFLASEFLIHSKTKSGISHLIEILSEKDYWSFNDMIIHEELSIYSVDLSMLLSYLINKNLIEVVNLETKGKQLYHRFYMVKKK